MTARAPRRIAPLLATGLLVAAATASGSVALAGAAAADPNCYGDPTGTYPYTMLRSSAETSGWTCAEDDHSGNISVHPGATSNWGPISYEQDWAHSHDCVHSDDSSLTTAYSLAGDISWNATNWGTSTHHYWVGNLFAVREPNSGSYDDSCDNTGKIKGLDYHGYTEITISAPSTTTFETSTIPISGVLKQYAYGTVDPTLISVQIGSATFPSVTLSGNNWSFNLPTVYFPGVGTWPVTVNYAGNSTTINSSATANVAISGTKPDASSLTPVITPMTKALASAPRVEAAADARRRMSSTRGYETLRAAVTGSGATLECPAGQVPAHGEFQSSAETHGALRRTGNGFAVRSGLTGNLQVLCRDRNAGLIEQGGLVLGSMRADRISSRTAAKVFAGTGDDRVTTSAAGAKVFAGHGDDVVNVRGTMSGVDGGFGSDTLTATVKAALDGGPGRDRLSILGSAGGIINAHDGAGGDIITCGSAKVKVFADKGDVVNGPCTLMEH